MFILGMHQNDDGGREPDYNEYHKGTSMGKIPFVSLLSNEAKGTVLRKLEPI
jgi:hypothetical protein